MQRLLLPALLLLALAPAEPIAAQSFQVDNYPVNSPPNGPVLDAAYQNDGRLIVVGSFTQAGSINRSRIARYTLTGSHDSSLLIGSGANGDIRSVAVTPDNYIIIGGDFTEFDGHDVNRLARLLPNGRIDTTFGSHSSGGLPATVRDIVVTSREPYHIYVGGDFPEGLRRFNRDGLFPSTIIGSGANGPVHAVAVEENPRSAGPLVTIGGQFTRVSGVPVGHIAFLDRDLRIQAGTETLAGANGPVYALALDEWERGAPPSDRTQLVIGGDFSLYNGQPRLDLATIFGDSTGFTTGRRGDLHPNSSLGTANIPGSVRSLAYDRPSNTLAVGGGFSSPGGWRNLYFASPWGLIGNHPVNSHEPNAPVHTLAFQPDGMLAVAGEFTVIDGQPRTYLARLYGPQGSQVPDVPNFLATGALDTDKIHLSWESGDNLVGYKLERRPVGGAWGPVTLPDPLVNEVLLRNLPASTPYFFRVSAFNGNGSSAASPFAVHSTLTAPVGGTPDPSYTSSGAPVPASHLAIDAQQRLLCAGFRSVFRLLPDGTLDPAFNATVDEGTVNVLAVQPDGRILVGGGFSQINGRLSSLVRLLPSGALDPSFSADVDTEVFHIQVLPDDRIAIAGFFGAVNGIARASLAVLHPNGRLDTAFRGDISGPVWPVDAILATPDGSLFAGGNFTTVNGSATPPLVKLTPAGELDSSFAIPSTLDISQVRNLALLPDEKLLVAGAIVQVPAPPNFDTDRLIRLLPDGSLDTTFGPEQFGQAVDSVLPLVILPQPDDSLVVSGGFKVIGATSRFGFAGLTRFGVLSGTTTGGAGLQVVSSFSPTGFISTGARSLVPLPDGRIAAAGSFNHANELPTRPPTILRAGPFPAPATAPDALDVTVDGNERLALRWNSAAQQTGYLVERSADGATGWTEIARLPASWSRFVDTDLSSGDTFTYRVRGISGDQLSAEASPPATATAVSAFALWLISFGLDPTLSPDLDLDNDRWSLYLEFALQRDPIVPEQTTWFTSSAAYPPVIEIATPRSDVLYELEQTADGQSWTQRSNMIGGSGTVLSATFDPATEGVALVLRLRVTPAP